jgi:hypothetical protein
MQPPPLSPGGVSLLESESIGIGIGTGIVSGSEKTVVKRENRSIDVLRGG